LKGIGASWTDRRSGVISSLGVAAAAKERVSTAARTATETNEAIEKMRLRFIVTGLGLRVCGTMLRQEGFCGDGKFGPTYAGSERRADTIATEYLGGAKLKA
jgi:hypothetical protein